MFAAMNSVMKTFSSAGAAAGPASHAAPPIAMAANRGSRLQKFIVLIWSGAQWRQSGQSIAQRKLFQREIVRGNLSPALPLTRRDSQRANDFSPGNSSCNFCATVAAVFSLRLKFFETIFDPTASWMMCELNNKTTFGERLIEQLSERQWEKPKLCL